MKRIVIFWLILLGLSNSQAQNWIPAGLPSGYAYHLLEFKCIYADTVNNIMYACGLNNQPGHIYRYNGNIWDTIGTFDHIPYSVITYNGMVIVGGGFTTVSGQNVNNIAMYDGITWHPFGNFGDLNNTILGFRVINNELYAFGVFTKVDSIQVNSIAKWNGTKWTNVNNFPCLGVGGDPAYVSDVVNYHNNLYVGGTFDSLGFNLSVYKNNIWQQVGTGLHGGMNGIARMIAYNDELYISGLIQKNDGNAGQGIQKWNDTIWSEPGGSVQDNYNSYNGFSEVYDMKIHNNDLYVCGSFYFAGHVPAFCLAKWDGIKWCGFGTTESEFQSAFNALGFINDTLFLSYGGDSLNGVYVDHLIKWAGGDFIDTCSNTSGIAPIENQNELINIYPNPADDILYIKGLTNTALVSVYDISGKQLFIKQLISPQLDISSLAQGMYFIKLSAKEGSVVRKFVK